MCITYHTLVCWEGRRGVLMLGSSLMLCSTLWWGMPDRSLYLSVLQPVSIIVLLRSFTAFSHSLLPLKADAQTRELSLALCCGLFPCPSLSLLFLPVVFPYFFCPSSFFPGLQFFIISHESPSIVGQCSLQPHPSGPFPQQKRDCLFLWK